MKNKIKNHMEKLFLLAVKSAAEYPNLRVVLLDRLPRLDSTTRADLGKEADQAISSLWEGNGRPPNILPESLKLQTDTANEKKEVFGRQKENSRFGIHLRGEKGTKEFTFRAGRLLCKILGDTLKEKAVATKKEDKKMCEGEISRDKKNEEKLRRI